MTHQKMWVLKTHTTVDTINEFCQNIRQDVDMYWNIDHRKAKEKKKETTEKNKTRKQTSEQTNKQKKKQRNEQHETNNQTSNVVCFSLV